MDLFVINRHTETDPRNDEDHNIAKLLKRIDRNKSIRFRQKEREREDKEKYTEQKLQTLEKRRRKREKKAKLIPIPPQDDNIDETEVTQVKPKRRRKNKTAPEPVEGFTVLGVDNFDKKTKVKRVLPRWLSNPTVVSMDLQNLTSKVSQMKELDADLRKKLKMDGIKYFFPVQATVIPWLLQNIKESDLIFPRDICVSAPTGSGKTLAFILPIIQALKTHTVKKIRALIILPTQELAAQIFKIFQRYTKNTSIDVALICGKNAFNMEQKQLIVENELFGSLSRIDVLICTAGRLVDHLKSTPGFNLQHLEFLIIDEADRVLDNVQNDWLYHLNKHIDTQPSRILNLHTFKNSRPPQKLLFSATLSQNPEKLQQLNLFQPKLFTSITEQNETEVGDVAASFIGKYTTPAELTEKYVICTTELKPLILYKLIKQEQLTCILIFTHSSGSVHRLTILLRSLFKDSLKIEEISSHLRSTHRNTLINDFAQGKIDILVATDTLSRGIDLSGIKCVISYSLPKYLKGYIHRVGRTARAGEPGLAVTLLEEKHLNKFLNLLEPAHKRDLTEIKIEEEGLEPLAALYKEALSKLKETVEKEEQQELQKLKSSKRVYFKQKRKRNVSQ